VWNLVPDPLISLLFLINFPLFLSYFITFTSHYYHTIIPLATCNPFSSSIARQY
jgi:hypothetical protein